MKKEYEVLFSPMKIGSCEIKNRFVMCPMEGTSVIDWLKGKGYKKEVRDLLVNRAKDGVGLIIPGAVPIYSFMGHKPLWKSPKAFKGVQELMNEIHSYGTKVFFQLSLGFGRNCVMPEMLWKHYKLFNFIMKLDDTHVSADANLPNAWNPEWKTRQLTIDEIHEYIEGMAETAYLCKINGVDGIDIHAVHEGYLLDQFTTDYTNHRKDEYGGSIENKYRFACELVKAIKKKCGEDYPVILRYSVESKVQDFNKGILPQDKTSIEIGRNMEESRKAIKLLEEAGYDAFNADNGTYDSWYYAHPPVYMPLNCNLDECIEIKKYTNKPVICAGRMQLDESSKAVEEGKIDGIGIARQFLADEKYLTKIREERYEDIIPCISCHVGCMPMGKWKNSGTVMGGHEATGVCALNPTTRYEKKYEIKKSQSPKHFAVIGAGIAGMEFAIQAVKRGHTVEIFEKSNRLGGVFNEAAYFTFKEKDRDLLKYYETQIRKMNIKIHYNSEIRDLNTLKADEIVLATGASGARQLKVDGSEKTISAIDFLKNKMECKDQVVIIGGGLTGCEIAYELCLSGKHPIIVEMQDDILKVPGVCMANTSFLRDAFEFYKVPVYTSTKTVSIQENCVTLKSEDGKEFNVDCDTVVSSIGYINNDTFGKKLPKNVHVIGDASKISNLKNAIWQANELVIKFK